MLAAILAAVCAVIVAVIVIVVVFTVVTRRKGQQASSSKKPVLSVESVGVASTLGKNAAGVEHRVQSAQSATGAPAGNLKPRFTAMTALAAAIFGALGIKLFGMQVLDNSKYTSEADQNKYTTVSTPAPRGYICDADGLPIVKNRDSLTVVADSDVANDRDIVNRLSVVLGVPHNIVRKRILDSASGAQSQRVVASDVRLRDIAFITEHADAFPGVSVQTRTVREYPYGALAAHVLGYTGSVSEEQLEAVTEGRTIEMGDDVGKSGVESMYDDLLAGDHGQRVVVADANGNVKEVVSETQPSKGSDVHLCIKAPVQYAIDQAMAALIAPEEGALGSGTGMAGSLVVMDVRDGGIVAMSNYPTYTPSSFIGGISTETWDLYNTEQSHYPLLNRAISGTYPAASTYKAFTSLAGLEYGFADKERLWNCEGSWDGFETGDWQRCWERSGHGEIDLRTGIVVSCDVVFYEIAKEFFVNRGSIGEDAMQDEIRKYRFGEATGIDLGGEAVGRVPTADWKAEYFKDVPEEAPWRGGDLTNMVIGQGYVLVTPMQLAVAYGAIATGKLMKPHVLKEIRNAQGDVVVSFEPEVIGEPDVKREYLDMVRDALHGVATENASIAALFSKHGIDGAAKTGTAEVAGKSDFGWFVCYGPYEDPKYVVACVIEEGGGGATSAAPIGVQALAAALQADAGTFGTTVGVVAGSTGKVVERTEVIDSERTD